MFGDTIMPDLRLSAKDIENHNWTNKMKRANLKGLMKGKSHDRGSSEKIDAELKDIKETNESDEIRKRKDTEDREPIEPFSVKMKEAHEDSEISGLPPKLANELEEDKEDIKEADRRKYIRLEKFWKISNYLIKK